MKNIISLCLIYLIILLPTSCRNRIATNNKIQNIKIEQNETFANLDSKTKSSLLLVQKYLNSALTYNNWGLIDLNKNPISFEEFKNRTDLEASDVIIKPVDDRYGDFGMQFDAKVSDDGMFKVKMTAYDTETMEAVKNASQVVSINPQSVNENNEELANSLLNFREAIENIAIAYTKHYAEKAPSAFVVNAQILTGTIVVVAGVCFSVYMFAMVANAAMASVVFKHGRIARSDFIIGAVLVFLALTAAYIATSLAITTYQNRNIILSNTKELNKRITNDFVPEKWEKNYFILNQ